MFIPCQMICLKPFFGNYEIFGNLIDHYQKIYNLNVWEGMKLYLATTCKSGSQMLIDTFDSIPEQHSFIEENLTEIRKPLFNLTMKAARNHLNVLLKHIQFVAQREQVDGRKLLL
ncbi:hypothetical protein LOD99_10846 [Oopsacas minuta]|uniref:Uncharacterized protein n=1 Tax=Oopsacas minuta TaxID=111878 RepID=A0AAV7KET7_9METZ|nr:hypothetical protein LOD99_10846 [Oopsacas minuta]